MKSSQAKYLAVVLFGMGWLFYILFCTQNDSTTLKASSVSLVRKSSSLPFLPYKPAFLGHPTSSMGTAQNDCERAYSQLKDFCNQEEQIWACEFLYQEERLSSEARAYWKHHFLALLQKACNTENNRRACLEIYQYAWDDLYMAAWAQQRLQVLCEEKENLEACDNWVNLSSNEQKERFQRTQDEIRRHACHTKHDKYACWQIIAAGKDEQTRTNASAQYHDILIKNCDLENDISACWELYVTAEEASLKTHSLDRFLALTKEDCLGKNDLSACWLFYNHSPSEEKARSQKQIWTHIQEACEFKGDAYACWLGYLDKSDDSNEKQISSSHLLKLCTTENNVEACSLVVAHWSPNSVEYQQATQRYVPLNIRACIEGDSNACQRIVWFPYTSSDIKAHEEQQLLALAEEHCNSRTPEVCKLLIRLYKEAGQCTVQESTATK